MSNNPQGLALFGGTFNPPHNGHIAALETVCRELCPARVLVVPAGAPVHKDLPEDTPKPSHRMAMARLAFQTWPGVELTDRELNAPAYTADTLEWTAETFDVSPLWLVVGGDMFLSLQNWHEAERIFALSRMAVLCREHNQQTALYRHAEFLIHRFDAAVDLLPHHPVELSSTQLRKLLKHGRGGEHMPEAVYKYIQDFDLYR